MVGAEFNTPEVGTQQEKHGELFRDSEEPIHWDWDAGLVASTVSEMDNHEDKVHFTNEALLTQHLMLTIHLMLVLTVMKSLSQ